MDNQHKKITGYRDLSQGEIDLMNEVKDYAEDCKKLCDKLQEMFTKEMEGALNPEDRVEIMEAVLWFKNGKRDLQTGFMKVVRSIARPTTF